jgi:hypothetical protein
VVNQRTAVITNHLDNCLHVIWKVVSLRRVDFEVELTDEGRDEVILRIVVREAPCFLKETFAEAGQLRPQSAFFLILAWPRLGLAQGHQ